MTKIQVIFNSNSNVWCIHSTSGSVNLYCVGQLHCNPDSEHTTCTLGTEPAIKAHTNKPLKLLSLAWSLLTCSAFRHRFPLQKTDVGKAYPRVRPLCTTQHKVCWLWPHRGCPGLWLHLKICEGTPVVQA